MGSHSVTCHPTEVILPTLPMAFTSTHFTVPQKVEGSAPDRPDVKIKSHGLGQYGAEPHYSTLPFWQLCALKG